jgi:hypothetical protein
MAFFSASTSPPALLTAFKAASLNRLRFSRASASRLALVLELPLGATSLRSLAESRGVKLTKSIAPNPPVGVFGVFGVRGPFENDRDRERECPVDVPSFP